MVLRMKNFNILGFTDFGGVCGHEEPIQRGGGGGALKGGLGQFANFRGGRLASDTEIWGWCPANDGYPGDIEILGWC